MDMRSLKTNCCVFSKAVNSLRFAYKTAYNHGAKVVYYTPFNGDVIINLLIIFTRILASDDIKKIFYDPFESTH